MQVVRKYLAAFAAACLLAVLAFGGVSAWAEPGDSGSWPPSGETNTLTVNAAADGSDYAGDIAGADVVVDVYKIANATPNSSYQVYDYTSVVEGLTIPEKPNAESWQKLANDAAKNEAFKLTADGTASAGTSISLDDGLYLVLAHGRGNTDSLSANSDLYGYAFAPTVVALPNKNTSYNTAGTEPWSRTVTISMKPEQTPLLGELKIVKTVNGFVGDEPATFTFHIESTADSPYKYKNDVAITFNGPGTAERLVDGINVGTKVTVSEVHEGSRYKLVSENDLGATIAFDEVAEVSFTNVPDNGNPGHGIENKFDLTKTGEGPSDWDWEWSQVPAETPGS